MNRVTPGIIQTLSSGVVDTFYEKLFNVIPQPTIGESYVALMSVLEVCRLAAEETHRRIIAAEEAKFAGGE